MGAGKSFLWLGGLVVCVVALAAGREFYLRSIAPLGQQETETLQAVEDLRGRVENARKTIGGVREQEKGAERVRSALDRLHDELPKGSPAVVVPTLVKEHFARFGIAVHLVRMNTTQDTPGLKGYSDHYFSVALPVDAAGRDVPKMLTAVADFDQQSRFVRVLDFSIRPDPENPGGRVGSLNLTALTGK